ncbi:family 16 glycosylhydrolase [Enterococcus cecorum]|uniref:family 16 glycosylhydrolase n=1 Tax=Enterococcus cecorum TaxID=44008 RepID=UPI002009F1B4|nr:family 16 glycosylhydrolase [Enterococcus cecorum]
MGKRLNCAINISFVLLCLIVLNMINQVVYADVNENIVDPTTFSVQTNSEHTGAEISKAFDNRLETYWDSAWYDGDKGLGTSPINIDINFDIPKRLTKFEYVPRQDDNPNGMILKYNLFGITVFGKKISLIQNGQFVNNHSIKTGFIQSKEYLKSIKLEILQGSYLGEVSKTHATISELRFYEDDSLRIPLYGKAVKVGDVVHLDKLDEDDNKFFSANPDVASVDENGFVRGIKEGTATIYEYSLNGTIQNFSVSVSDKAPVISGKKLVFEDNFDGDNLDSTKWNNWCVDLKQPGLFRYDNSPEVILHPDNVRVAEGTLQLIASKEETDFNGKVSQYRCGTVQTRNKFEGTYGYVTAKVLIPDVAGSNPAIWMMPQMDESNNWMWGDKQQFAAEIDILERPHPDGDKQYEDLREKYWITMHYDNYLYNLHKKFHVQPVLTNPYSWHEFSIEWTPDYIHFLLDGNVVATQTENIPNQPEIFILSYGLGGWIGKMKDSQLPDKMLVDYVRWYQ